MWSVLSQEKTLQGSEQLVKIHTRGVTSGIDHFHCHSFKLLRLIRNECHSCTLPQGLTTWTNSKHHASSAQAILAVNHDTDRNPPAVSDHGVPPSEVAKLITPCQNVRTAWASTGFHIQHGNLIRSWAFVNSCFQAKTLSLFLIITDTKKLFETANLRHLKKFFCVLRGACFHWRLSSATSQRCPWTRFGND